MNIIRHEPSNHFICFFLIHLELDVRESRRKCNRRSSSYGQWTLRLIKTCFQRVNCNFLPTKKGEV